MKVKMRFSELSIGEKFEWAGKSFTKTADRIGVCALPRCDYIFNMRDTITVEVEDPDETVDDLIDFYTWNTPAVLGMP